MSILRFAGFFLCAVLSGGCRTAPVTAPTAADDLVRFCPECWHFCRESRELTLIDACETCAKVPVRVDARAISWYDCEFHDTWHSAPCRENVSKGCCTPWTVMALGVFDGTENVFKVKFCPSCRRFMQVGVPMDASGRCSKCGRAPVVADVVVRNWFWCDVERAWLEISCSTDRAPSCCTLRYGTVPAFVRPQSIPLPQTIGSPEADPFPMLVTTDWLAEHLSDPDVVVLHVGFSADAPDALSRGDYLEEHIPGARFLSWGNLTTYRNGIPNEMPTVTALAGLFRRLGIDECRRIVVYDTGNGLEAARAFVTLDYIGLGANTALLDGHWKKWRFEERPAGKEIPEVVPSYFVPHPRPDVLVSLPVMRLLMMLGKQSAGTFALVDARSFDEYAGAKAGKGVRRAGHIPGAVNIPWIRHLRETDPPQLRSREDLDRIFRAQGSKSGLGVVAYCRTGVQASHTYFVARYLGLQARLYDGSFLEWSARDDLPVEKSGNLEWGKR